ncbi:MAG: Alpha/beta hydrolase family protein [Acidobacteria bacterium]|nr:Alpha/beta hydrolase family protein [Acidobacteriota bacterium]
MLQLFFHAWERRLASITKDRVVRPFEWGLDWIPDEGRDAAAVPVDVIDRYVSGVMADTDAFFTPPPTADYTLTSAADGDLLTFPSAFTTPHESNNTVRCRYFRPRRDAIEKGSTKAAVLVMPQWNSDAGGHVGLCKLLAWNGMSALRLSLPYHDDRMPPELHRADYIVSANVMRTLQVCRQAVLDARRAIAWLKLQGYERIGILGTSLGSCLALLTAAHEPLVDAEALNHISPYFADVVWRGLSTAHVRAGLNGHVELDLLRSIWQPISPRGYLERLRNRKTLLVYARYDLTFPVDLSEELVQAFKDLGIPHEVAVLRCGHYSTGKAPFKFVDGYILTRFLKHALNADPRT